MNTSSPESKELTSESPLALALATVLTSEIINQSALSEALLAGKSLDIIDQLKQLLPQENRDLLAQNLLEKAMPAINATPDGETIDQVPDNLFLLACALGVPEVDRKAYIAKHMKTGIDTPEGLAQELVTMRVITADQVPSLVAQYQIVELELPAHETEGQ